MFCSKKKVFFQFGLLKLANIQKIILSYLSVVQSDRVSRRTSFSLYCFQFVVYFLAGRKNENKYTNNPYNSPMQTVTYHHTDADAEAATALLDWVRRRHAEGSRFMSRSGQGIFDQRTADTKAKR